jgi:LytS/YehU family sensor histidine kinase
MFMQRVYWHLCQLLGSSTVDVDVEPEALGASVPNLILQPLVENSIRHGIAKRRGPGRVAVRAARSGAMLELAVRDDGVGLGAAGRPNGNGIGLGNTRERLEQLYGGDHRFELRDAAGGGVEVAIAIPFRIASEADDGAHPRDRR